jgi:hypothetical protein
MAPTPTALAYAALSRASPKKIYHILLSVQYDGSTDPEILAISIDPQIISNLRETCEKLRPNGRLLQYAVEDFKGI